MAPQRCLSCRGLERHRANCPQVLQQIPKERPCPDCGSRLRMLLNFLGGPLEMEVYYYADEPRSWVTGVPPAEGLICRFHCTGAFDCGRIAAAGNGPRTASGAGRQVRKPVT